MHITTKIKITKVLKNDLGLLLILLFAFVGTLHAQTIMKAPLKETFDKQPWSISISNNENVDTNWNFIPKRNSFSLARWGLNFEAGDHIGSRFNRGTEYNDSTGKLLRSDTNLYSLFVKPRAPINNNGHPDTASILSPTIDISSLSRPQLSFDYHARGIGIVGLTIEAQIDASGNRIFLDSLIGQQQNWGTDHFKRHFIDLSLLPDTIKVRFNAFIQGKYVHASIDNVEIKETPPCLRPNRPQIIKVDANSATFRFDVRDHTAQTELRYGPVGLPISAKAMKSVIFTGDTVHISGLRSHRLYNAYFRPICGGNPGSYSAYPLIIRTPCMPVTESFPYKQGFDAWLKDSFNQYFSEGTLQTWKYRSRLSDCWEDGGKTSVDSLYSWQVSAGATNALPQKDHSGKGNFVFPDLARSDTAFLTSPPIDLTKSVRPQLSFWYHNIHKRNFSDPNRLFVDIFNGNTWQLLTSFSDSIQNSANVPWKEKVIDLSRFKDTIKVRFYTDRQIIGKRDWPDPRISISGSMAIFLLDDVHFREKSGCALAGQDSLVQLCDSLGSYDLSNLLDSNAAGGTWQDINGSGALSGTLLNLGQLPQDSAFPFRYLIPKDSACSADSATYTIIRNKAGCSIGLEEYQTPGLDIFPNPAQERLYLRPQNSGVQWGTVALYNLQGQRQKVALSQKATGARELSLAGLSPGVYFLTVELEGKKVVRKVVVE